MQPSDSVFSEVTAAFTASPVSHQQMVIVINTKKLLRFFLPTVGTCLCCEMRHATRRGLVFGLSNMKNGSLVAGLENLLLFHSMFRTIQYFPQRIDLLDSGSFPPPSHGPLPWT